MPFLTAVCSHPGGRIENEDTVLVSNKGENWVLAVADGLGGYGGGAKASALAVKLIADGFLQKPDMSSLFLERLFAQANEAVLVSQTAECHMKTTITVLFARGTSLITGFLGDTRLYFFHNGQISLQTQDHSVSQMAVYAGEIEQEEIRHHPDRARLLKVLGMKQARPELLCLPKPSQNDAYLICTDGFWEKITEARMEQMLVCSKDPGQWLQAMRSTLGELEWQNGDNFSAVAAFWVNE